MLHLLSILSLFLTFNGLFLSQAADEIPKGEERILVLNEQNFNAAIKNNKFIFVEFYAPWCGHCKALAPEYAKAAELLAESNPEIKLGKVDATVESDLAEAYNVTGYPTLKLLKDGKPIEYKGGRNANDIIAWLKKKTGPPAKEITTVDACKQFIDEHSVTIVGFFKDTTSTLYGSFIKVCDTIDDYPVALVSDPEIFKHYEIKKDAVVLFKKFDEGKVILKSDEQTTEKTITDFITYNALPLVVEFNHETAQQIFGGGIQSHLLLFLNKSEKHYKEILEIAQSIARKFRDQVLFVTIDVTVEDHVRILDFFGMKDSKVPEMRIIKLSEDMMKFKPETDEITALTIEKFVQDFVDNKLEQHLLAQDLPEDWDKKPVKVLVASNFDEVALNPDKDVLVEFYAPWCGHCQQLVPIYDQLGDYFKDRDDVEIAKIDSTANELNHTKVSGFPTIKLYKKVDNTIVDYKGPRTLEGMKSFVESGGEVDSATTTKTFEEGGDNEDDVQKKDEL